MSNPSPLLNKEKYLLSDLSAHIISVFSRREAGNMSLCYGQTQKSLENRRLFLNSLGIDFRDLICAKQVHKSLVACVREADKGKGAFSYSSAIDDTDALITDKKQLPLAIFTADCLPIFLYDPERPAIGLIHAGWGSTREKIAQKSVMLMQEAFHTHPENLSVGFGPAIRSCCYEVGREFQDFFPTDLVERGGSLYLDIARSNKKQFLALGVKEENFLDSQICTSCQNKSFFSYRKEKSLCGRMVSVMMLR